MGVTLASSWPSADAAHLWAGGPREDARLTLASGSPGAVPSTADLNARQASLGLPESSQPRALLAGWASCILSPVPFGCKMPDLRGLETTSGGMTGGCT